MAWFAHAKPHELHDSARLLRASFFSCPAQSDSGATDAGRAHVDAMLGLEEATMLFSSRIGMNFYLRSQVGLQHRSFFGRTTWDRFWQNMTGFSSLFPIAFDRGPRDGEHLCYLGLALSGIDCAQHSLP